MTRYIGTELDLFAAATCWKRYFAGQLAPYLGERVLEVGAGLGGSTPFLYRGQKEWVCLEPDQTLAAQIDEKITQGHLPAVCRTVRGTLVDLNPEDQFDTLLYLDVLEHIEDDQAELARAAEHLRPGGHLIVLAPAHPFLYTPFDRAIGHYRRYSLGSLKGLSPPRMRLVLQRYLDSVGLLASLGNRLLLRQSQPTTAQVHLWDRVLVRCSRWVDPCTFYRLGKSVVVVWRKEGM